MSFVVINDLLNQQVATVDDIPPIRLENTQNAAKKDSPFIHTYLLPTTPRIASLGVQGETEWRGLFQVSLFYPSKAGVSDVYAMVDSVVAAFTPGTRLVEGGINVLIQNVYPARAHTQNNYFSIPITIEWSCWLNRPEL